MSTAYGQPSPLSVEASARLDTLFRLYNDRLVGFARSQVRVPADAEDVISEMWLRAALSIHQLQSEDARAYGWLRAIASRASVDLYRPRRADERPADWSEPVTARALPAAPPADVTSDVIALSILTSAQAVVIKLKAQGYSDMSVARRLGRSETAVRKRKHAGARRLRSYALAG